MIKSVDVVSILGNLCAGTAPLDQHTIEGLGIPSIAGTPEGDSDNSDWLIHFGFA